MKWFSRAALQISVFTFLVAGTGAIATGQDSSQPAPDNTKANQGDQDKSRSTADRQDNDPSDRKITQQIRQSVMDDKTLSTYAHNVKIVSRNGMVTLKGPVRSDDEKRSIETKAAEVVGRDNVTSELQVASK
jgi:hyperosmotically inducible periplasmic protein